MNIRCLKYFIAITEEGSLSAASQRLGVAQPSLSLHVSKLEHVLGVTLLKRSARGVAVTPSGEIFLKHAREMCCSLEACQELLRQRSPPGGGDGPEGAVALGLPSCISMVLAVPLAETVRLELPRVRLRVIDAMSGFVEAWLHDGSVDLGVLYDAGPPRQFGARELVREELRFFAALDAWPFRSVPPGAPVRFEDVCGVELALPSRHHGLRRTIDRYACASGLVPGVAVEMDALTQIKELAVRGSCFTVLPPAAAQDRTERGELVSSRIVRPPLTCRSYLVRKLGKPQSLVSRAVERVVFEVVSDLVKRGIWPVSGGDGRGIGARRCAGVATD